MAKPKKKKKARVTPAVEARLAHDYGYTLAFLKSDHGLYSLFKQAVNNNWPEAQWQAQVKASKWYKTHGETYRTNLALKATDPGTYNERLRQKIAELRDTSYAMGAPLSPSQLKEIAEQTMSLGYTDAQLQDVLSHYVKLNNVRGQATSNLSEMKQSAWRNGVKYSDHTYQVWLQSIAAGSHTMDDWHAATRKAAKSLAPGYAKELDGGMDLYDLAQPYMQSMSSTLELDPQSVDLFDPTVRKAMSGITKDGKPATTSLWQFEQQLKSDKRWLGTKNAQDDVMQAAHKVLTDFGFMGS